MFSNRLHNISKRVHYSSKGKDTGVPPIIALHEIISSLFNVGTNIRYHSDYSLTTDHRINEEIADNLPGVSHIEGVLNGVLVHLSIFGKI